jgi:molybdopterin-guanine dinucleotide biosynthesis protein A
MRKTEQVGGFILAGGESSRMGRDKALLELGGETLIARTANLVEPIVGTCAIIGGPGRFAEAREMDGSELRVIADDFPGAGPLGGIATALCASGAEWNLVVACDLPYLTRAWLEFLIERALRSDVDAVLPMNERGAEPLCAMYRKRAGGAIRAALERGTRKVTDGLADVRIEFIEPREWKGFDSDGLLFKNMNSPADYEEAKAKFEERQKR